VAGHLLCSQEGLGSMKLVDVLQTNVHFLYFVLRIYATVSAWRFVAYAAKNIQLEANNVQSPGYSVAGVQRIPPKIFSCRCTAYTVQDIQLQVHSVRVYRPRYSRYSYIAYRRTVQDIQFKVYEYILYRPRYSNRSTGSHS
jgi:hypothetical protein